MSSMLFDAVLSNLRDVPFNLEFAVTNRCNLRCIQCDVWRYSEGNTAKPQAELTTEEVHKIFSSYQGLSLVGITGGEPYLRTDLAEIVNIIIETQEKLKSLSITSNGQFPETTARTVRGILAELARVDSGVSFTQFISIDGPKGLHDRLRGVAGAHDRAEETIRLLCNIRDSNSSLHVGIVTDCSPFNIDQFHEVVSHVSELKEEYALEPSFCIWFQGQLYRNLNPRHDVDVMQFRSRVNDVIPEMRSIVSGGSLVATGRTMFFDLLGLWLQNPANQIVPCGGAKIRYFLGATGDVYPCTIFDHNVGNLRDHDLDLRILIRSSSRRETRDLVKAEKCPICCNTCETIPAMMASPAHTAGQWLRSKLWRS